MRTVVPGAQSIEALLHPKHQPNFVSLTAPQEEDTGRLFAWSNDFAWTYDGDVADGIAQRVKAVGGNVDNARLRVSFAWSNYDDLDIHAKLPNGTHIYYGNKGGILDVDMNAGFGETREPVENLSWVNDLPNGSYRIWVHNFHRRESHGTGFVLQVAYDGQALEYMYDYPVAHDQEVPCLTIDVLNGSVVSIDVRDPLVGPERDVEKWGVRTGEYTPVDSLILSPNHWRGESKGNKHYFFILRGCINPGECRGMYNEFLRSDLHKHRKVFEVLGSKIRCPASDEQMSGIGFSSTKRESLRVRVVGQKSGIYEIKF